MACLCNNFVYLVWAWTLFSSPTTTSYGHLPTWIQVWHLNSTRSPSNNSNLTYSWLIGAVRTGQLSVKLNTMVKIDHHEYLTQEERRLEENYRSRSKYWLKWGPYVAERQWATGEQTLRTILTCLPSFINYLICSPWRLQSWYGPLPPSSLLSTSWLADERWHEVTAFSWL